MLFLSHPEPTEYMQKKPQKCQISTLNALFVYILISVVYFLESYLSGHSILRYTISHPPRLLPPYMLFSGSCFKVYTQDEMPVGKGTHRSTLPQIQCSQSKLLAFIWYKPRASESVSYFYRLAVLVSKEEFTAFSVKLHSYFN